MQARVKDSYFLGFAQAAGIEFIKGEFRSVPEHAEEEIKKASFLEIFEEEEIDAKAAADSVDKKGKTKVKVDSGGKIEKPKKAAKKKAAPKSKSDAVAKALAKAEAAEKEELKTGEADSIEKEGIEVPIDGVEREVELSGEKEAKAEIEPEAKE